MSEWEPVPSLGGRYEASTRGQIRNARTGFVLKPRNRGGRIPYWVISVRRRPYLVHQLVLEAHAGARPEGCESLHGVGGSLDNRWPENLRWGTSAENAADRLRDGTQSQGETHGGAVLTSAVVMELRRRFDSGERQADLAREFGITFQHVHKIVRRQSWQHLAEAV